MDNQQANSNDVNDCRSHIRRLLGRRGAQSSNDLAREACVNFVRWLGLGATAIVSCWLLFWALAPVETDLRFQWRARTTTAANLSRLHEKSDGASINKDIPEKVSFSFHVRPILSENCFYCHGLDANHRSAGLRVDTAEGALGHAVEPGDLENSEMIARILSDDLDVVMPPPSSGRVLSERDKKILAKWVLQGAKYERHWAFSKPVRPALPAVRR